MRSSKKQWDFSELPAEYRALIVLVCVAVGLTLIYVFAVGGLPWKTSTSDNEQVSEFVPGPPPPEVVTQLEQSRGFEALISYTDRGFEPAEVSIASGESVRFTNNSSRQLWIAAVGTASSDPYPGTSACGGSSLDSCQALDPRDFWEFTFERSGEWTFQNILDQGQTGIVHVQVE